MKSWVQQLAEELVRLEEEDENQPEGVDMSDPRHRAANDIHNAWMKRNPKADWNAHQHVPYEELPHEEREKDAVHVDTIHEISKKVKGKTPEETRHLVADAFGARAHEAWRRGFDPEGTGKARMKKVSDGSEVNINVPWEELHPEWKKENYEAGLAAHDAVREHFS